MSWNVSKNKGSIQGPHYQGLYKGIAIGLGMLPQWWFRCLGLGLQRVQSSEAR